MKERICVISYKWCMLKYVFHLSVIIKTKDYLPGTDNHLGRDNAHLQTPNLKWFN